MSDDEMDAESAEIDRLQSQANELASALAMLHPDFRALLSVLSLRHDAIVRQLNLLTTTIRDAMKRDEDPYDLFKPHPEDEDN